MTPWHLSPCHVHGTSFQRSCFLADRKPPRTSKTELEEDSGSDVEIIGSTISDPIVVDAPVQSVPTPFSSTLVDQSVPTPFSSTLVDSSQSPVLQADQKDDSDASDARSVANPDAETSIPSIPSANSGSSDSPVWLRRCDLGRGSHYYFNQKTVSVFHHARDPL